MLPLVAVGGIVGALLRWFILDLTSDSDSRSFALLAINVVGAGIIGWLAGRGYEPDRHGETIQKASSTVWPLVAIGFCGGFTSFARFTLDIAERLEAGEISNAATLTVLTLALTTGVAGFMWRRNWLKR
jgi:CrcB protein